MADQQRDQSHHDDEEPLVSDKRRIDPVTGEVRRPGPAASGDGAQAPSPEGGAARAEAPDAPAASWDGAEQAGISDDDLEKLLAGEGADDAPVEGEAAADAAGAAPESDLAAERLRDLQRVQAEYANYRRRTEREREEARDRVTAEALSALFPVLDDLDRAEQHGDLAEGTPLGVIAGKLRGAIERQGITGFGEAGEAFDPQLHEAIAQLPNPEVEADTVADVVQRGYAQGDRVIRVAKVAVFVPAS